MADTAYKTAIDRWFESRDGEICTSGAAEGQFLRNRLKKAFAAGWNAQGKVRDDLARSKFLDDMMLELESANAQHSPYSSYHEAYAVILEEVDEFWEIVKQKRKDRNDKKAYAELVQIAVTAWRTTISLNLKGAGNG